MTNEEIQNFYGKISLKTAEMAFKDVKERLQDALDTKKSLEQKASTVLGGYITLDAAIFGLSTQVKNPFWIFTLCVIGSTVLYGLVAALCSLRTSDYGAMGSYPDAWIREGIIDGDELVPSVGAPGELGVVQPQPPPGGPAGPPQGGPPGPPPPGGQPVRMG